MAPAEPNRERDRGDADDAHLRARVFRDSSQELRQPDRREPEAKFLPKRSHHAGKKEKPKWIIHKRKRKRAGSHADGKRSHDVADLFGIIIGYTGQEEQEKEQIHKVKGENGENVQNFAADGVRFGKIKEFP